MDSPEMQHRIARPREVMGLTGRSRTTLWRLEREKKFPARVRLGPNSVGYRLAEVLAWIARLPRVGDEGNR